MRDANWHLFLCNGMRFLLDARTGALWELDEVGWDVLELWGLYDTDEITKLLGPRHGWDRVTETISEVRGMLEDGILIPYDLPCEVWSPPDDHVVKALCLNVAHDCNMRCSYCFAGAGGFGGKRGLMPLEVARRALDFLFENMGPLRNCEVDFFGGEPLLNWEVVACTIAYGQERARALGKEIHFTLTTNATLLDEEKARFLVENGVSVILSLDGRREINDRMRVFPDGSGSYRRVLEGIRVFLSTGAPEYYVRGTFTRANLDFCKDVEHLVGLGVRNVSLEPVVGKSSGYGLRPSDLPRIRQEYERLADYFVDQAQRGEPFSFFHFNVELYGGPCLKRRVLGCGAGNEYLACTPDGGLYPCHQFAEMEGYRLGDVFVGLVNEAVSRRFREANIYTKEGCPACWARFYCSGGCHASALNYSGDILHPDPVACELQKKRIECALMVKAVLSISGG